MKTDLAPPDPRTAAVRATRGEAPTKGLYAGLFLVAGAIILFQVALTRVFAIMMWHHLTYMVVSVALLGFGAAGSWLTARGEGLREGRATRGMTLAGTGFGVTAILALLLVTRLSVNTLELWSGPWNLLALLAIYVLVTIPLLLGGVAIGLALTRHAAHVNRVYFADLLGSGAGGAASVFLLDRFGGATTVVLAGAIGAAGSIAFAGGDRRLARRASAAALAGAAFAAWVAGFLAPLGLGSGTIDVPFAADKEMGPGSAALVEARLPSATAEVEVSTSLDAPPIMGGEFGVQDAARIEARAVAQDGTAPTQLWAGAADLERFPFLDDTQAASGYRAFAAAGGSAPKVLVIGVGGGVDVMVALAHGASRVDAAEINRAMIRMVREDYDAYLGGLFRPGAHAWSDRIHLVQSEGRSFMRHSGRRYDLIQMSGVDSFTALSTGAYTLSESYLYTVEAVGEFLDHLEDGGIVTYSRFILSWPKLPRETLRLANIAYEALHRRGVADPASCIAVFQGRGWASTMIRRGAFTREQMDALHRFAAEQQFHGLVFDPTFVPGRDLLPPSGVAAGQVRHFAALDAKDFDAGVLDAAMASLSHAAMAERSGLDPAAAPPFPPAAASLAARAGEAIAFLQQGSEPFLRTRQVFFDLLRAAPAERERYLAEYPYDVSPCTDDAPFFFNYYKYSGLLDAPGRDRGNTVEARSYHPEYPVGHMILISSLAQIALLGALLLLLPLRALARKGLGAPRKGRVLAYFTALGVAFMCIEIVLMQKVVIVLGHPTYALSVVLTTLLGFAGLGSLAAGRLVRLSPRTFVLLGVVIAALVLATAAAVNVLPPLLLGWSFPARVLAVVSMCAPLSFALGMPFPLGLRVLEARSPQLVPWAWAVNGFSSVFASLACIVASMALGFTVVLCAAAAMYLAGCLALRRLAAPAPAGG